MSTNDMSDLLKNPDQIKQMISLLSTLLEASTQSQNKPEHDEENNHNNTQVVKHDQNTFNMKKTENTKENKFLSMPESSMYKEDPEIAKKLYKQPPMARNRKNQTIRARCRVCGKEEKIQSSLLYGGMERFKCNKCSATPG